jgi:hypothetical protein
MRYVELRRHTDNEGDRLTPQGAADAEMIGRGRLHPPYAAFVSTGAARVTQMLEILRRCGKWSPGCPKTAAHWWWATAPPARPPCSGWPAGLSRHWARAKESC